MRRNGLHFLIPDAAGPIDLVDLRHSPRLPTSLVLTASDHSVQPWSADYDGFTAAAGPIGSKVTGEGGAFTLRLSGAPAAARLWEMPVLAAHWVLQSGVRPVGREASQTVVWILGVLDHSAETALADMRAVLGDANPGEFVASSLPRLREEAESGRVVIGLLARGEGADEALAALSEALPQSRNRFATFERFADVMAVLDEPTLPVLAATTLPVSSQPPSETVATTPRRRAVALAAGVAALALVGGGGWALERWWDGSGSPTDHLAEMAAPSNAPTIVSTLPSPSATHALQSEAPSVPPRVDGDAPSNSPQLSSPAPALDGGPAIDGPVHDVVRAAVSPPSTIDTRPAQPDSGEASSRAGAAAPAVDAALPPPPSVMVVPDQPPPIISPSAPSGGLRSEPNMAQSPRQFVVPQPRPIDFDSLPSKPWKTGEHAGPGTASAALDWTRPSVDPAPASPRATDGVGSAPRPVLPVPRPAPVVVTPGSDTIEPRAPSQLVASVADDVRVYELHPPRGGSCLSVYIGETRPVREALSVSTSGRIATSRRTGTLCGFEIAAAPGVRLTIDPALVSATNERATTEANGRVFLLTESGRRGRPLPRSWRVDVRGGNRPDRVFEHSITD